MDNSSKFGALGDNNVTKKSASALAVQSMALFGTFLLLISFGFYIYVMCCLLKAKIWKLNPFYQILLSLGLADNLSIIVLMYCYITAMLRTHFMSVFGRTLLGIFIDYNSIVIHWHYLFIAVTRAVAVIMPVKAKIWLSMKNILAICGLIWLLSAGQWGIHGGILKDIIYFEPLTFHWELSYPDQVVEIPFGIYGLFYNIIGFACVPFYIVAFYKLRYSANLSHTPGQVTAQWNLLKLGGLCLVFVISSANFYQAVIFGWLGEGFWVNCVQSGLHALLLGVNPFLYVMTSSQIRNVVPLMRKSNTQVVTPLNNGYANARALSRAKTRASNSRRW